MASYSIIIIVVDIAGFLLRVFYFAVFSAKLEAGHKSVSTRKRSSTTKHCVCIWIKPHWLQLDVQVWWQILSANKIFVCRSLTNLRRKIPHSITDTGHLCQENARHVMVELTDQFRQQLLQQNIRDLF